MLLAAKLELLRQALTSDVHGPELCAEHWANPCTWHPLITFHFTQGATLAIYSRQIDGGFGGVGFGFGSVRQASQNKTTVSC